MLSQAVILVGGLGTRLGELTAATPKPLLPVAGRPFVEHLMQELSRYGVRRVTLLAARFGDLVRSRYHGTVVSGLPIDVLVEPFPLGTGGALTYAASLGVLDAEFILLNGDSWIDMDLVALVRTWREHRTKDPRVALQVLLQHVPDAGRFGRVEEEGGYVSAFKEKSPEASDQPGRINAGVYIVDRHCLGMVPPAKQVSLETDLMPSLVAERKVVVAQAPADAFFLDIGLPATYVLADTELMRHRRRPAVFFDRDGTLNLDQGYTHRPDELLWVPEAREAVRLANDAGYYVFVVTNQSGLARGFYTEQNVVAFHDRMQEQLFEIGAHVDEFAWCPHHPDGRVPGLDVTCDCRKPAPGLLRRLMTTWAVDVDRSWMIGDSESDLAAGRAAGVKVAQYVEGSLARLVSDSLRLAG